jgi:hypothetical protein
VIFHCLLNRFFKRISSSGERGLQIDTGSTLGTRRSCGLLDGTGQYLDALVRLLVVYYGIPRESDFKAGMEGIPVHSREFRAVREVLNG